MPYRIDPNTGQPVWDGTSIPQASRDSLGTQIRNLQDQIDTLSFIDLDDAPTTYTGQSGKIVSVKSTEDGLEFITNSGGSGGVSDGDKGDIIVSSSGTVWTIDAGAVTSSKIATGAVGATQLASTTVTAGSYTLANITVDADGRITAASNGSAGPGTVTSVSVATANGVSGTVATATSTPEITLTLGAITPSSVNGVAITNGGSGALTVSGTASVSGTNTGNQTITLTGDVTGSGTGSFAASIASNAVTTAKLDAEAVTYAKIQSLSAASTLLGRGTTGGTLVREIAIGAGLSMSGDTLSATTGSGDVVGPASSVDNTAARFDSTTGKLIQGSAIVIDDESTTTANNVTIAVSHAGQANSSLVLTPQGTGALIVGPKPDGTISGGNARGARSVDLQLSRTAATQVALGVNSFIAGGTGHTITSGGTESVVIGGANNSASAQNSAVLGGNNNSASGPRSVCLGGNNNNASGGQATAIGTFNTASSITTLAIGQSAVANRFAMLAHSAGNFSSSGDAQVGIMVARNQTSSATITDLFLNGTSDRVTLLSNQSMMVDVFFVARSAGGVDEACFHRRCLIARDAGVATTAIVGSVQTVGTDIATAGASAWAVTVSADTTNGALRLQVTGAAATNINWVAKISTLEVIRA